MSTTPHNWKYLDRKPGSLYKQLAVKGRNIFARTLYARYVNPDEPETPEAIAADYGLPVEAVLEAIAYCESNPPEIASDWAAEEALAEATGMNDPNYKGKPRILSTEERARLSDLWD
jgi:uncharacterized protein (DUF433 family)